MLHKATIFLVFFVAVALAASVGALFPPGEWYKELTLPSWTPPNAVFGPVWTILYAMIAIAGYRYTAAAGWRRLAHGLFFTQLALNAAWTAVFFGLKQPVAALAVIIALETLILATIAAFAQRERLAATLLVPYALWVAYAMSLNIGIVVLN